MILIIGPAFSGKRKYAQKIAARMQRTPENPQQDNQSENQAEELPPIPHRDILTEVQDLVLEKMTVTDLKVLADGLCARARILTASETGAGIVPVDGKMRRVRENQGTLLLLLTKRADCVVRVFYGIPEVILGSIPEQTSEGAP